MNMLKEGSNGGERWEMSRADGEGGGGRRIAAVGSSTAGHSQVLHPTAALVWKFQGEIWGSWSAHKLFLWLNCPNQQSRNHRYSRLDLFCDKVVKNCGGIVIGFQMKELERVTELFLIQCSLNLWFAERKLTTDTNREETEHVCSEIWYSKQFNAQKPNSNQRKRTAGLTSLWKMTQFIAFSLHSPAQMI